MSSTIEQPTQQDISSRYVTLPDNINRTSELTINLFDITVDPDDAPDATVAFAVALAEEGDA